MENRRRKPDGRTLFEAKLGWNRGRGVWGGIGLEELAFLFNGGQHAGGSAMKLAGVAGGGLDRGVNLSSQMQFAIGVPCRSAVLFFLRGMACSGGRPWK